MQTISKVFASRIFRITSMCLVLVGGIAVLSNHRGFAAKYETLEAQAFGTGTQMGQNIGVTLNIYQYSTPADRVTSGPGFREGPEPGANQCLVEDEGRRPCRDYRHARL